MALGIRARQEPKELAHPTGRHRPAWLGEAVRFPPSSVVEPPPGSYAAPAGLLTSVGLHSSTAQSRHVRRPPQCYVSPATRPGAAPSGRGVASAGQLSCSGPVALSFVVLPEFVGTSASLCTTTGRSETASHGVRETLNRSQRARPAAKAPFPHVRDSTGALHRTRSRRSGTSPVDPSRTGRATHSGTARGTPPGAARKCARSTAPSGDSA